MKHEFLAQKDLVVGDKHISRGDVLLTVETEIPLDRALNAIHIGHASVNKPEAHPAHGAAKAPKQPK